MDLLELTMNGAETVEAAAEVAIFRHRRRLEGRRHTVEYLRRLIADGERMNKWQLVGNVEHKLILTASNGFLISRLGRLMQLVAH